MLQCKPQKIQRCSSLATRCRNGFACILVHWLTHLPGWCHRRMNPQTSTLQLQHCHSYYCCYIATTKRLLLLKQPQLAFVNLHTLQLHKLCMICNARRESQSEYGTSYMHLACWWTWSGALRWLCVQTVADLSHAPPYELSFSERMVPKGKENPSH